MKKTNKIIIVSLKFIRPLVSVWVIVGYYRLLSYLYLESFIGLPVLVLMFLPAVLAECAASSIMREETPVKLWPERIWDRISLSLRIFFWAALFIFWLVIMSMPEDRLYLRLIYNVFFPNIMLIYAASSYLTIAVALLWMTSYWYLTYRMKKFRVFNSFVLPGLLTFMLFYYFYGYGGLGRCGEKRIIKQPGVTIFYSRTDFPREDYFHHKNWTGIFSLYPRDLFLDAERGCLYAVYAKTFGSSIEKQYPNLLKIDMANKQTDYRTGHYIRSASAHTDTIISAPWYENTIFEIDKDTLETLRQIPVRLGLEGWEALSIYHDTGTSSIYLTTDVSAGIFRYDYDSGDLLAEWIPEGMRPGALLWNFRPYKEMGTVFVTGSHLPSDIYEIEMETLSIKRSLDMNTPGGSALLLDEIGKNLYFQDGHSDRLYEIDIENLEVRRQLKGSAYSQKMYLDRSRSMIYILSYLKGKLIAVDMNTGRRSWQVRVGGKPAGMAVSGDSIYINSMSGIIKVDLNTVLQEYRQHNSSG